MVFILLIHSCILGTINEENSAFTSLYNLDFELDSTEVHATNWECEDAGYEITLDSTFSHSGSRSGRLSFVEPGDYLGTLSKSIPFAFQGEEIVLSGFFRKPMLGEESGAGVYINLIGSAGEVTGSNFIVLEDSIENLNWRSFEISVENSKFADSLFFGAFLIGPGNIWIDNLQLQIDGNPISEAIARHQFPALNDIEFDAGSGIAINEVNSFQTQSLVQLGKIWAFLKYHHPDICNGKINWDYELFRVIPSVIQASTPLEREQALLKLLSNLSPVLPYECNEFSENQLRLAVDLSWINLSELGATLTDQLQNIYRGRYQGSSYHVRSTPYIFFAENSYENIIMPDAGFRLLALYRYYGMVEYYFPYRYATNNTWSEQIEISLPSFIEADTPLEYQHALQRLITSVGDSHARLLTESEDLTAFLGEFSAPLHLCRIEDYWVVDGYTHLSGEESDIRVGDVILSSNGVPVADIVERLLPYSSGSNEESMFNIMGRFLLRENSNSFQLEISRGEQIIEVTIPGVPVDEIDRDYSELPVVGEASYSIMNQNVGYVHIGTLTPHDIPSMKDAFKEIDGLVIDLRSYPYNFPLYDIASYIVPEPTPFVLFSRCDFDNPGSFYWDDHITVGGDDPDPYTGRVALIIDIGTASSGEFHAMALRLAPEAMVFGHPTCGADGNVTEFFLPGGMHTRFTGLGVYNPDSSETQRVGIIPDVLMNPTIPELQAGRDELLEAAVDWVLSN